MATPPNLRTSSSPPPPPPRNTRHPCREPPHHEPLIEKTPPRLLWLILTSWGRTSLELPETNDWPFTFTASFRPSNIVGVCWVQLASGWHDSETFETSFVSGDATPFPTRPSLLPQPKPAEGSRCTSHLVSCRREARATFARGASHVPVLSAAKWGSREDDFHTKKIACTNSGSRKVLGVSE